VIFPHRHSEPRNGAGSRRLAESNRCKASERDVRVNAPTGLRKSEASNLTVRRIDLAARELHVVEGAKGGHARIVPIESSLVQRLAEYLLLEGLSENDYLWYCHPGGQKDRAHDRPLVGASMHKWWTRSIAAAGVRYRKLHCTRHTYATEWRRRGLMTDDVGWLLGHQDLKTTQRVYVHTTIFDVRRRMEELTTDG
jgi:integrase